MCSDLTQSASKALPVSALTHCRPGCGACCIAPQISSPLPGMPAGKPAGVRCIHLNTDFRCELFGKPERPAVCSAFLPTNEVCGSGPEQAIRVLTELEQATAP